MRFIGLVLLMLTFISLSSDGGVAAVCSSPYCPAPWRAFKEHCYLWMDKPMSWMDAERYCQMLSHPGEMVHLASIHSQEEDDFIKSYVRSSSGLATSGYWIGYSDIVQEGHFQWSDGSNVSYEGWAPGKPSDSFNVKAQDCVAFKFDCDRNWNDKSCLRKFSFVCKM